MNHTACSKSSQFLTSDALHSFRAPICTNVREHLSTTSHQIAKQHSYSVASIILCSQYVCLANTVPVECTTHQCFCEVAIRLPVCPLALSLETASYCIVADSFFFVAHLEQFRIALHQVAHDQGHFHHKLPVGILLFACLLTVLAVLVPAFVCLTIFLGPCHRLFVFFVVIDTFFHTAQDLCFIHALIAHTEVALEEILVYDTACDTHTLATDRQVTLTAHICHSNGSTCKAKQLFSHVCWDSIVVQILYVVTIDAKGRKPLLCMTSQHCSQVNCTRALCAVETPNSLRPVRVHVHRFRTIAPARSHCDCSTYAFAFELFSTCCSFCYATDSAVGDNALHRCTICVAHILADQFCHGFSQRHGLFFQTFSHSTLTSVDGGTNSDFRIFSHDI